MKFSITYFLLLFISTGLLAEGTREIRPTESDTAFFLLSVFRSQFGLYDAPETNQINITVADLSETIYLGMNNTKRDGVVVNNGGFVERPSFFAEPIFVSNIPFRVRAPSGLIVFQSIMPGAGQEGNIATYEQAINGPRELGNPLGYDAIELTPTEIGDYVIEFDPLAVFVRDENNQVVTDTLFDNAGNIVRIDPLRCVRLGLDLFDVTVTDNTDSVQLGRLHSAGWQITTESFENPFNAKVYPYDGANAVYEVDFNGMQPFEFTLNFNASGVANTGDFIEDRRSIVGFTDFSEFQVFLNPPDSVLFPTIERDLEINASAELLDCESSSYCINVSSTSAGAIEVFLDFNNNGTNEPGLGEVTLGRTIDSPGNVCIPWNGRDAFGNLVRLDSFNIEVSLAFGITHLPLFDVEHNRNGFIIDVVRPTNLNPPIVFWDDSNIPDGRALDGLVNTIDGCIGTDGCHRWENRGALDGGNANGQETINTYWNAILLENIFTLELGLPHTVDLSLEPDNLVKDGAAVCSGDEIDLFINNDGEHFDTTTYAYEWFLNNVTIAPDLRQQTEQIDFNSTVVLRATNKQFPSCIDTDTLLIEAFNPIVLSPVISDPLCTPELGSVFLNILDGPPDVIFQWEDFPAVSGPFISGLDIGTYEVFASNPNFPNCAAAGSYSIVNPKGFGIDTVNTLSTLCFEQEGSAQAFLTDPSRTYTFTWNNDPPTFSNFILNLPSGPHSLFVQDVNSICADSIDFIIPQTPIDINLQNQPEFCSTENGSLSISNPGFDFIWSLNGVAQNSTTVEGLAEGEYNIIVTGTTERGCFIDTTFELANIFFELPVAFDYAIDDPANIFDETVSIDFENLSNPEYTFLWDLGDGSFSTDFNTSNSYFLEDDISFLVSLTATDTNGCTGIDTARITRRGILEDNCGIALPNAFSPNGDDFNDELGILGFSEVVDLKIYNRLGEVVHRAFSIDDLWDGTYRGEDAPLGVYAYVIKWQCVNETTGITEIREAAGDIALVR